MEKLIGCALVLAGCTGFAGSLCRERQERVRMLKQIRGIYEDLKYYISYQRATVLEAENSREGGGALCRGFSGNLPESLGRGGKPSSGMAAADGEGAGGNPSFPPGEEAGV